MAEGKRENRMKMSELLAILGAFPSLRAECDLLQLTCGVGTIKVC